MAVFTGYNTVRTAMFALIDVEKYYRGGIYQNVDLAFSDHMSDYDSIFQRLSVQTLQFLLYYIQ